MSKSFWVAIALVFIWFSCVMLYVQTHQPKDPAIVIPLLSRYGYKPVDLEAWKAKMIREHMAQDPEYVRWKANPGELPVKDKRIIPIHKITAKEAEEWISK